MKILLVEDDLNTLHGLTDLLHHEGYQVYPASNVDQAKRIYQKENPEIVLSDFRLPDSNGINLCRLIRGMNSEVILFLFTAYSNSSIRSEAEKIGVREVFSKPIDLDRLFSCLEKIHIVRKIQEVELL